MGRKGYKKNRGAGKEGKGIRKGQNQTGAGADVEIFRRKYGGMGKKGCKMRGFLTGRKSPGKAAGGEGTVPSSGSIVLPRAL